MLVELLSLAHFGEAAHDGAVAEAVDEVVEAADWPGDTEDGGLVGETKSDLLAAVG